MEFIYFRDNDEIRALSNGEDVQELAEARKCSVTVFDVDVDGQDFYPEEEEDDNDEEDDNEEVEEEDEVKEDNDDVPKV